MESPALSRTNSGGERWSMFCAKFHKEQIIYFTQIFIVYTVIVVCLIKLSQADTPASVWASILGGSVGYILPAPKIKKRKNVTFLPNVTEQ